MGNNESVQNFMKIVHVLDSANFDFSFSLILCRNTQEFMEIIKLKFAESKTCTRVMNFCTDSFFLIYVMLKCQSQSQLVYFRQLPQAPMLFQGASELHKLARFNTGVNGENPDYLTNETIFHRFLVQALSEVLIPLCIRLGPHRASRGPHDQLSRA